MQSQAKVFIGNSSAGLIEAPYFKLPVINIGLRQQGREHASNIIHVEEVTPDSLKQAYDLSCSLSFRKSLNEGDSLPFGNGKSAEKMVEILKSLELGPALFEKRNSY